MHDISLERLTVVNVADALNLLQKEKKLTSQLDTYIVGVSLEPQCSSKKVCFCVALTFSNDVA